VSDVSAQDEEIPADISLNQRGRIRAAAMAEIRLHASPPSSLRLHASPPPGHKARRICRAHLKMC
jgi:hypothetical protein